MSDQGAKGLTVSASATPCCEPPVRLLSVGTQSPVRGNAVKRKGAACIVAVILGLIAAQAVSAEEPAPARQRELLYRLEQDCGSCHGLRLKGGLGPPLLPVDLKDKPDEALVDAILQGRPGTPMPPWGFELSEQEARWLVEQLKQGIKK